MKKLVCLISIAILFQIVGCKDQFVDTFNDPAAENAKSFSAEALDWNEAMEDPSFQNLLSQFGELQSDELILKGASIKKTLKLNKSKVKKINLGKNESYTILIDSLDFNSLKFSNLLLAKNGDEENAYIINYFPERSWVASYISGVPAYFIGKTIIKKININNYLLKSIDCSHVVIYIDTPCTGTDENGPCEHILGEDCGCTDSPFCDEAYREIIYDGYVCYDPSDGGEETYYDSAPDQNTTSNYPEGGGISSVLPDGIDPDDVISITDPIVPYDNGNLSPIEIYEDLLGVEVGLPASIHIEDPLKIDLQLYLKEASMVAMDQYGGFYYMCKGKWIYYRDGKFYGDVGGIGFWAELRLTTNSLSSELTSLIGRAAEQASLTALRYLTPAEELYILLEGEDFDGIEQNQLSASGILLLGIVPETKLLKPLKKVPGVVSRFFAGIGDEVFEIATRINGIPKFTSKGVEQLAKTAVKYKDGIPEPNKVMLGKNWKDGVSYVTEANNRNCLYFELDDWDELEEMVNFDRTEMFKLNKRFLDDMHDKGKEFYFSHNPYEADGFLLDEVNHLRRKGYTFDEVVGENIWKARMQ